MPKHSFLPRNRSGFTMIELALTLTVIAIMTAMMIPRFGRVMNSTRVNRTASRVAADMEQALPWPAGTASRCGSAVTAPTPSTP